LTNLNILKYSTRIAIGNLPRAHYGYCVFQAANLAAKLGIDSISIIEFGVAGGNGLLNLEFHADQVSKITGVKIEIYGFDTGEGLPKPSDYRDLAYHWQEGFYAMDVEGLRAKLRSSQIVFGDVKNTAQMFFKEYDPAPIGAIMFDLDYYSSTMDAFELFKSDSSRFLPRVFCYFDDVIGGEIELYGEHTGERLAIQDFNEKSKLVKISEPFYLRTDGRHRWHQQIWITHFFKHQKYNQFISVENQQSPVR